MYSVVLAAMLTAGTAAPDMGWKGCHGCYGSCYGSCYGVCYGCSGCYGCGGCYGGCWGCSGCYGGCSGCWGCGGCYGGWSCHGCCGGWTTYYPGCSGCWGCGGCYGGCWGCGGCYGGCSGCYGGWSCCGGWSCHGCCGGWSTCAGCHGIGFGYAAPAHSPAPIVNSGYSIAPSNGHAQAAPLNGGHVGPINGGYAPSPAPSVINQAKLKRLPATVVVRAAADVKVLVNGEEAKRNKEVEVFTTPELTIGKTYSYVFAAEIKVEGKVYTTSKKVLVRAGQQSEVNFGDMSEVIAEQQALSARITVILPTGGKLFVDGKETPTTGQEQTFDTPKLARGKSYFYVLKVDVPVGKEVDTRTERVTVEAGKEVVVDFRQMFVAER